MHQALLMLLGCTLASIANAGLKPEIGALDIYLRPQAVQNVLNDLDYLYKNGKIDVPVKTINPDIHFNFSKFGVDFLSLDINNITLNNLDIESEKFGFNSDAWREPLHINLKGIDVDVTVDGNLDLMGFLKCKIEGFSMTKLNLIFNPKSETNDLDHWRVIQTNKVDFDTFGIKVDNSLVQKLIDFLIPYVLKVGKPLVSREVSKMVDAAVNNFNIEVRDEKPTSWKHPVPYFVNDISYAMTVAPEIDSKQDLISFNLKGLFVDPTTGQAPAKVKVPTIEPPFYQDASHQAQVWLHESLINSGVLSLNQSIFPVSIKDKSVSDSVKQLVYQISKVYGNDVEIHLDISVAETDGNIVNFRKTKGLMIGEGNDLQVTIEFVAAMPNGTKTSAFTLQTFVIAELDVIAQDFIVQAQANDIRVFQTTVIENHMGLYHMEWDMMLNNLLHLEIQQINNMLYEPIDCTPYIEKLLGFDFTQFVSNSTVDAQYFDEFLYLGIDTVDISV